MGHPADLLAHVAADLRGCDVVRVGASTASVQPARGAAFHLTVQEERRRLLHLQTLRVHVDGATVEPGTDPAASLVFHHTGQLRRTGLTVETRLAGRGRSRATPPATLLALRDRLVADGELEAASLRLDFTTFELVVVDGHWRATLELMGGSHVRTTLPPTARYVRLTPDQVTALLATVDILDTRLRGDEPPRRADPASILPAGMRAADHLPARRR
jgi:hypothetical protein